MSFILQYIYTNVQSKHYLFITYIFIYLSYIPRSLLKMRS
uniref:Uncharacterized protein n=1 Tax=Anguilla anguilla TaxID=7936 RepID=A0A0E9TSS9_ANGAN